jgi:hypothetical protein
MPSNLFNSMSNFQSDFISSSFHTHRIAFGSCNNANRQGVWSVIKQFTPNTLILLGDNVYVDDGRYKSIIDPIEKFTTAYSKLLIDKQWIGLVNQVGGWNNIHATFDDHDYGQNNANKVYTLFCLSCILDSPLII